MVELILMAHVLFGVACLITAVWIFVEVLHASETNQTRIRRMSLAAAVFMWLAFCIAGYWYVVFYKVDKAIILKGPWPFAHSFFSCRKWVSFHCWKSPPAAPETISVPVICRPLFPCGCKKVGAHGPLMVVVVMASIPSPAMGTGALLAGCFKNRS